MTLFGWALVLGGALRIVAPRVVEHVGGGMMDRPTMTRFAGGKLSAFSVADDEVRGPFVRAPVKNQPTAGVTGGNERHAEGSKRPVDSRVLGIDLGGVERGVVLRPPSKRKSEAQGITCSPPRPEYCAVALRARQPISEIQGRPLGVAFGVSGGRVGKLAKVVRQW